MKRTIMSTFVLFIAVLAISSQNPQKKVNPAGPWNYVAPYAPEGYGSGTIVIAEKDKALTASISFTGSEYKIPAEKVTVTGDTLTMVVYLDGTDITIKLKMESADKMSGVALSPDGEIPLTLTKQVPPKK